MKAFPGHVCSTFAREPGPSRVGRATGAHRCPRAPRVSSPDAIRGIGTVAKQLAEQQVAVLLQAADVSRDADSVTSYRSGDPSDRVPRRPSGCAGVVVLLKDGLVGRAARGRDRSWIRPTAPGAAPPRDGLVSGDRAYGRKRQNGRSHRTQPVTIRISSVFVASRNAEIR